FLSSLHAHGKFGFSGRRAEKRAIRNQAGGFNARKNVQRIVSLDRRECRRTGVRSGTERVEGGSGVRISQTRRQCGRIRSVVLIASQSLPAVGFTYRRLPGLTYLHSESGRARIHLALSRKNRRPEISGETVGHQGVRQARVRI